MHGSSESGGHSFSHGFGAGISGAGHGVHDLVFDHGHAGIVTFEAIMIGRDYTGHFGGSHNGSNVDMHSNFHAASGSMEGNGPMSFELVPKPDRKNFGLLVIGVSAVDWETMARNDLAHLGLAECLNLQPPNALIIPPHHFSRLLPINFKNPLLDVKNPVPPSGSYPGATGSTTVWRTNWQEGGRSLMGALTGGLPQRKKGVRTYIEEEVTAWHYFEANDFEIRFVVRVLPGHDNAEAMRHVVLAQKHCQHMLKALEAKGPSSEGQAFRRGLIAA